MVETLDKKELTVADLKRANVPPNFWYVTVSSIPEHLPYLSKVKSYYAQINDFVEKGIGMYIFSTDNQTGKTSVAVALLKRALRLRHTAFFSEAGILKNALTKNQEFDDMASLDQRIRTVDLLVIDDLGKEYRTQSGYAENTFENILRDRIQTLKPTIITSNLHPREIEKIYSKSLSAVLKGNLIPLQVTGYNWTAQKQKEIKEIL